MNKRYLVFIDWYGTLNTNLFWQEILAIPEMAVAQQRLIGADHEIFDDWMRGKYSSEEINWMIAEWSGLSFDFLWPEFIKSCREMTCSTALKEIISVLRDKVYVVLATSNTDCFKRFTVPALGLEEVFDKIVVSSDLGFLKTEKDGEFFLSTAREFSVPVKDICLVDDSKKTCDFFEGLGGRVFRVNGPEDALIVLEKIAKSVILNS